MVQRPGGRKKGIESIEREAKEKGPVAKPKGSDEILRETLRKAYLARAKLFVEGIRQRGVNELAKFLAEQDSEALIWDLEQLAITDAAFKKVTDADVEPHMVFCHPQIIASQTRLIDYYRNLSALSKKGLSQMLADQKGQERIRGLSRVINSILSSITEDMEIFDLALAQAVIAAEIGAEMQGTWVNIIGKGAATRVHELITDYAERRKFIKRMETVQVKVGGRKRTHSHLLLTNDWHIIFGDEPDVAIRDKRGVLRVAIEIKGSMDKAGAQTRYGEAKKSFAKALKQYGQCETIYLASCFTKAVMDQIRADAQVRKIFNLIDIIEDRGKRDEFLKEIFVHQIRIE